MVCGKGFEVPRRVYVDFEGINFRRKFLTGLEPESINMTIGKNICVLSVVFCACVRPSVHNGSMLNAIIYFSLLTFPGSLQIQKLGVLSELSSNGRMLYPVGYQ